MAEILLKAMECHDYPVCIPTVTLLHGRFWIATDGFF